MQKNIKLFVMFSMLLVVSCALVMCNMFSVRAATDIDESWGLSQMVPATVDSAGEGNTSLSGSFEYRLVAGTWGNYQQLNFFNTTEKHTALFWDGTTILTMFQNWQIQASLNYDAAIEITALSDTNLSVGYDAFVPNPAGRIIICQQAGDVAKILLRQDMATDDTSVAYTLSAHLKAGDKLYYILQSDTSVTAGIIPMFHSVTAQYDESARDAVLMGDLEDMVAEDAYPLEFTVSEMVSAMVRNSGEMQTCELYEYQLQYGVFGAYKKLNIFYGTGLEDANDFAKSDEKETTSFYRWQVRSDKNSDAVIYIRALKNFHLDVSNDVQLMEIWAMFARVSLLQRSGNEVKMIFERQMVNNYLPDQYGAELHVKAGDEVFFIFSSDRSATVNLIPKFSFDEEGYDQSKHDAMFSSQGEQTSFRNSDYFSLINYVKQNYFNYLYGNNGTYERLTTAYWDYGLVMKAAGAPPACGSRQIVADNSGEGVIEFVAEKSGMYTLTSDVAIQLEHDLSDGVSMYIVLYTGADGDGAGEYPVWPNAGAWDKKIILPGETVDLKGVSVYLRAGDSLRVTVGAYGSELYDSLLINPVLKADYSAVPVEYPTVQRTIQPTGSNLPDSDTELEPPYNENAGNGCSGNIASREKSFFFIIALFLCAVLFVKKHRQKKDSIL